MTTSRTLSTARRRVVIALALLLRTSALLRPAQRSTPFRHGKRRPVRASTFDSETAPRLEAAAPPLANGTGTFLELEVPDLAGLASAGWV